MFDFIDVFYFNDLYGEIDAVDEVVLVVGRGVEARWCNLRWEEEMV